MKVAAVVIVFLAAGCVAAATEAGAQQRRAGPPVAAAGQQAGVGPAGFRRGPGQRQKRLCRVGAPGVSAKHFTRQQAAGCF